MNNTFLNKLFIDKNDLYLLVYQTRSLQWDRELSSFWKTTKGPIVTGSYLIRTTVLNDKYINLILQLIINLYSKI